VGVGKHAVAALAGQFPRYTELQETLDALACRWERDTGAAAYFVQLLPRCLSPALFNDRSIGRWLIKAETANC
jgi:hypothetical protein